MICESMAICRQVFFSSIIVRENDDPRYLAREMGLSGKTSLENAMLDEIVDVVQDVFDKNVSCAQLRLSSVVILLHLFSTKPGTLLTRRRH